jgi:hypothetical protein
LGQWLHGNHIDQPVGVTPVFRISSVKLSTAPNFDFHIVRRVQPNQPTVLFKAVVFNRYKYNRNRHLVMVPQAGLEPALLSEQDFESSASTNSTTGAQLTGNNPAKRRSL